MKKARKRITSANGKAGKERQKRTREVDTRGGDDLRDLQGLVAEGERGRETKELEDGKRGKKALLLIKKS